MSVFPALGFSAPWLLLALLVLPVLWFLLRALPPAAVRRRFPGVALLLGMREQEEERDKTPWWLLLLRVVATAAIIFACAGPVLNPRGVWQTGTGPVLVLLEGGWPGAALWEARKERVATLLNGFQRSGRPVALMRLTSPEGLVFTDPAEALTRLEGMVPQPWQPGAAQLEAFAREVEADGPNAGFDTVFLSDGLANPSHEGLLEILGERGRVRVIEDAGAVLALRPAVFDGEAGEVALVALRSRGDVAQEVSVLAHGTDPSGAPRVLARVPLRFEEGAREVSGGLALPGELRARIQTFELEGGTSAGRVVLADDLLRRREVALITQRGNEESARLLSPLHYLEKALMPAADILLGSLSDMLPANPDVIVLADSADVSAQDRAGLLAWVEKGGVLLRFAGPVLARSEYARGEEDALMPVRLRSGGREVGGAMSWGEPREIAPFDKASPFAGLSVPDDVRVRVQVIAQPDPTLASRVIAQLRDGTPLVTRKKLGRGQVVLFHVAANAEWSDLPLSGLFVQMLERLAVASLLTTGEEESEARIEKLKGTLWQPHEVLDGLGRRESGRVLPAVAGEELLAGALGPDLRPGVYRFEQQAMARNVVGAEDTLTRAHWPQGVEVEALSGARETLLAGIFFALALVLVCADLLASLALSGRLFWRAAASPPRSSALVVALALAVGGGAPDWVRAQEVGETGALALAYVITGDEKVDEISRAGLQGLSNVLFYRTSVEPVAPVGVDPERDELALYPLLYWPVTSGQTPLGEEGYRRLNGFLRGGGMILFDTRDSDIAEFGVSSANGKALQVLADGLEIPALEPMPADHVLSRTFYLLNAFPGRHPGGRVWLEAAPAGAERVDGMPFRRLNDGVSPVVIGGNDWASAWAVDEQGQPLFQIGHGLSGARQRELAYRFGVNLVMYVLTGNYKSDQVHVPALLERLGQ